MKIKSWIKIAVVAVLIVLVACLALNGIQIGKYIVTPVGDAISLGLDLQGGISTVYVAKDSSVENFDSLMESTISVLRTRLTNAGYTEATVARQGSDAIRVEIPDVTDPAAVLDLIGSPAKLEFRDPQGNTFMDGSYVQAADGTYATDENGRPAVSLSLTPEGQTIFGDMTAANIGNRLSIYLDGELLMEPTVQSAIYSNVLITGVIIRIGLPRLRCRAVSLSLRLYRAPIGVGLRLCGRGAAVSLCALLQIAAAESIP